MRDLMFLAGFLVLLPLSISNAFVAYLIWGWSAIIAIDAYLFGFMQGWRFNMIFGLVALTMILLRRDTVRGTLLNNSGTFILLALFLLQATISAAFAYGGNPKNWELYDKVAKTLIFVFVMPLVVVGRYRIHAMVVMLCLGLAFHGLIDGLKFIASGGGHLVRGLSKFGDNNHFSVMLVMAIPLLLYLSRYSASRMVRWGALIGAFLTFAAVIGTHSRGGLLTLLAMGAWFVLSSRQRAASLALFAAGFALVVLLAPASWTERMETIQTAKQDSSFMGRVEAWQVSSAIALGNPLTGGGLHAIQVQSVWDRFKGKTGLLGFIDTGEPSQIFRAAHSIYFETMGDMGFMGFFIFMAIMINGLLNGRRIAAKVRGREGGFEWALDLSRTLTAVVVGFLVGGASISIAYSEVIYVAVMLSEILRREVFDAAIGPVPLPSAPVARP